MNVNAVFLIEPFNEGAPGPHVTEALEVLGRQGHEVDVGPFGSSIRGPSDSVLASLGTAFAAALAGGATRVTLTIETDQP